MEKLRKLIDVVTSKRESDSSITKEKSPIITGQASEVAAVPLTSILSPKFDTSVIVKEDLDLEPISKKDKLAFLLHNVFTREECVALIKISEDTGYTPALVNIGGRNQVLIKGFRDSFRVLIDDKNFASALLNRISHFLPKTFQGKNLVEVNERFRFLRYDKKDKFQSHVDGSYMRDDHSAITLITLQIYLNEGFKGGETTFLQATTNNRVPVVPKTGMILVFEHKILHEGSMIKSGRKYTIRTDVLYTYD